MKSLINIKYKSIILLLLVLPLAGCEKYLENTRLPANTIDGNSVYLLDNTTSATVTSVFLKLNNSSTFGGSASQNLAYTSALYTDETKSVLSGNFADVFYKNSIQSGNSPHWNSLYSILFTVNSAIEGIKGTTATLKYRDQWLGESYFQRAFLYFNLVNIYGDVPLALTTDYKVNNQLFRAPQNEVYQQIIADLKEAQSLLSAEYRDGFGSTTTSRARPNKAVATALLAKAYLYAKDWENAEAQATALIEDPAYTLEPLDKVFLTSSKETVWALAPNSTKRVIEYDFYNNGIPANISAKQTPANFFIYSVLSDFMLKSFEGNDKRTTNWVRAVTAAAGDGKPAVTYYMPNKYKTAANTGEIEVMLRLADQYLIRAEARAQQNKSAAVLDLNAVRSRAGLDGTKATTQPELLKAIYKERKNELFTEGANRFFDLKRTGTIDEVMNVWAPQKPTTWASYMALWPIPPSEIANNPNLTPNPGYLQ